MDMLSPHDSSSSSSSSSTSTITSASTTTTTSTQSQSQTQPQTGQSQTESQPQQSTKRPSLLIDMLQLNPTTTEPPAVSVAPAVPSALGATGDSGTCTPTLPPVLSLDAESLEALYEQCVAADSFDRLYQAVGEVFSSVERLSKSFVCPPGQEFKHLPAKDTSTTTTTTKEQLNKEQLRQLEGEHDKDEDSTQRENEPAEPAVDQRQDEENVSQQEDEDDEDEPMASCRQQDSEVEDYLEKGTKVDFCGLRRVKRLLFGAPIQTISDRLTNSVAQLAESIHYMRLYRQDLWEQVLHCLVICFDMATNSEYIPGVTGLVADFNL